MDGSNHATPRSARAGFAAIPVGFAHGSRPWTNTRLALLVMFGAWWLIGAAQARAYTLSFGDPAGDSAVTGYAAGDFIHFTFTFDGVSGAYEARFFADPSAPFVGSFELNLGLINVDRRFYELGDDELHSQGNLFELLEPATMLTLTGLDPALTQWTGGQRIRTSDCSLGGGCFATTIQDSVDFHALIDEFDPEQEALIEPLSAPSAPFLIRIDFSGEFSACNAWNDCAGTPLAPLAGTPFSGTVLVPGAGIDAAPEDPERGSYAFSVNAYMTLTTVLSSFDLEQVTPIEVLVRNCIGASCAPNSEAVWLSFDAAGYEYVLALGTPRPPFSTDHIPTVAQLQGLYATFEILTDDFSAFIGIDSENNPETSPMTVSITSVPLPTDLAAGAMLVPVPTAALLGLAMLCAAIARQCARARREDGLALGNPTNIAPSRVTFQRMPP